MEKAEEASVRIWKEFTFDAAHRLPNLPDTHPCSRLHGHTYRFRLHITGVVDPQLGWITDFGGLVRAAGDLVCKKLDHRYLNEIEGLENPTAEHLVAWILQVVQTTWLGSATGFRLSAVELFESSTTGVWLDA